MDMGEAEYLEQRLDDQIDWYDAKSSANQKAYKRLRFVEILAAASIPLLAGYSKDSEYVGMAVGAIGLVVAVIAGIVALYRFQENWIEYRATAESLKQEKYLYLTRTEPYHTDRAFDLLVGRVEGILKNERSGWTEAMRAAGKERETDEATEKSGQVKKKS